MVLVRNGRMRPNLVNVKVRAQDRLGVQYPIHSLFLFYEAYAYLSFLGGLPTLYYATLQLHNNAGKDIELIESEGKEPPHLLTMGEIRKIKLIGHEAKHYKFEAIDNSTGESLALNNQAFTSITLGDDPDQMMEITISKPSKTLYLFRVNILSF